MGNIHRNVNCIKILASQVERVCMQTLDYWAPLPSHVPLIIPGFPSCLRNDTKPY